MAARLILYIILHLHGALQGGIAAYKINLDIIFVQIPGPIHDKALFDLRARPNPRSSSAAHLTPSHAILIKSYRTSSITPTITPKTAPIHHHPEMAPNIFLGDPDVTIPVAAAVPKFAQVPLVPGHA